MVMLNCSPRIQSICLKTAWLKMCYQGYGYYLRKSPNCKIKICSQNMPRGLISDVVVYHFSVQSRGCHSTPAIQHFQVILPGVACIRRWCLSQFSWNIFENICLMCYLDMHEAKSMNSILKPIWKTRFWTMVLGKNSPLSVCLSAPL